VARRKKLKAPPGRNTPWTLHRRRRQRLPTIISCREVREAISALVDGEESSLPEPLTSAHLAECRECRTFQADIRSLTREIRVRALRPIPSHTAEMLASLGLPSLQNAVEETGQRPRSRRRQYSWLRATQWVAGLAPLCLALPALAFGAFDHIHLVGSHVLTPCTFALPHDLRGR